MKMLYDFISKCGNNTTFLHQFTTHSVFLKFDYKIYITAGKRQYYHITYLNQLFKFSESKNVWMTGRLFHIYHLEILYEV